MPEPPTDDEIQRLVETQPGMLDQAAGLLKKLLAKEITPKDAEFQTTELKIQLDENIATVNYPRLKPGACKRLRGTKQ